MKIAFKNTIFWRNLLQLQLEKIKFLVDIHIFFIGIWFNEDWSKSWELFCIDDVFAWSFTFSIFSPFISLGCSL